MKNRPEERVKKSEQYHIIPHSIILKDLTKEEWKKYWIKL